MQVKDHAVVFRRVADAIDRRNRGDHDAVLPLQNRFGRRKAHLLDVLVDRRILLDVQIARRHIRFGLVIIVIGNEILDRIFGKELAEFGIELRRERLVRREHDRRPAGACDHVGHGVGLARARHAKQRLISEPVLDALDQLVDRLRLVAGRQKRLVQLVGTVGKRHDHGHLSQETVHFSSVKGPGALRTCLRFAEPLHSPQKRRVGDCRRCGKMLLVPNRLPGIQ